MVRYQPDFAWDGVPRDDRHPFLILKGDETVGVVIIRVDGDVAHVELDYVTKRFRDFSPGEFVWRESGMLRGLGHQHASSRRRTRSTRTTPASASAATGRRTSWRCDARGHRQPDRDGSGRDRTRAASARQRPERAQPHPRSSSRPSSCVGVFALLTNHAKDPLSNTDTYFHLRFGHEFLTGNWSLTDPGA